MHIVSTLTRLTAVFHLPVYLSYGQILIITNLCSTNVNCFMYIRFCGVSKYTFVTDNECRITYDRYMLWQSHNVVCNKVDQPLQKTSLQICDKANWYNKCVVTGGHENVRSKLTNIQRGMTHSNNIGWKCQQIITTAYYSLSCQYAWKQTWLL
jgi:hypothetical protein